jgi:hypothetical protein
VYYCHCYLLLNWITYYAKEIRTISAFDESSIHYSESYARRLYWIAGFSVSLNVSALGHLGRVSLPIIWRNYLRHRFVHYTDL